MSLISRVAGKVSEDTIGVNPAVQTGYVVQTDNVINQDLKNPYFYALNNMSAKDGIALQLDGTKNTFSFAVKDTNGVSRQERVFVNPKYANTSVIGNESGKFPVGKGEDSAITLADMIFSGTNNQLPTVVGMQTNRFKVYNTTQTTLKDIAEATPLGDPSWPPKEIGYGSQNEGDNIVKPNPGKLKINKNQPPTLLPKILDKNGKEVQDTTQRGPFGNSLRVGTTKVSSAELSHIIDVISVAY
jgi:hypothetical protein